MSVYEPIDDAFNIGAFIKNQTMIRFMWYNGQHDPNHIMQIQIRLF